MFEVAMCDATYIELHCHSCFSFREGASTPLELVLQARRLGYPALALTDHDGLAGAMEFAQTAKEWGVAPIIGAELTLREQPSPRPTATPLPKGEGTNTHLTLLAETPRGYANLSRLLSMALLGSPRGEPELDPAALAGRTEGLIALSGCRDGAVSRRIGAGDVAGARTTASWYAELFDKEHFFIELQDNLVYGDRARNRGLVELARELDLAIVATNNVHYHERARHRLQDVLVAVRHRTTLDASERLRRRNAECYLKSPEEMAALFSELPESLRNSVSIAERCVGLEAGGWKLDGCPELPETIAPLPLGEGMGVREQTSHAAPQASTAHRQGPDSSLTLSMTNGNSKRGFDLTRDLTYEFPDFQAPNGMTADEFLEEVCFAAARELYG
ncbi:MAG: PHP domain-containing protein [Dehalococcoidia bacterium]